MDLNEIHQDQENRFVRCLKAGSKEANYSVLSKAKDRPRFITILDEGKGEELPEDTRTANYQRLIEGLDAAQNSGSISGTIG